MNIRLLGTMSVALTLILTVLYVNDSRATLFAAEPLDSKHMTVLGTSRYRLKGGVSAVACSPDGTTLAIGGWKSDTAQVIRPDGTVVWSLSHPGGIGGHRKILYSPDSKRLLSSAGDGTVRLWDLTDGRQMALLKCRGLSFIDVAFSPDGTQVVTVENDGALTVWDGLNGTVKKRVLTGVEGGGRLSFSPNGRLLLLGEILSPVTRLLDWDTGKRIGEYRSSEGHVSAVTFSPTGDTFAVGTSSGAIQIWTTTGKLVRSISLHRWTVKGLHFLDKGKTLIAGDTKGLVSIHDVATGDLLKQLEEPQGLSDLAFCADGRTLALAGSSLVLLDRMTGEPIHRSSESHHGWIVAAAACPAARLFATAGKDGTVRLWNSKTERAGPVLRGHTKPVSAIAFTPDGKTLASASLDGTVRLWNLQTGRVDHILREHHGAVTAVAISKSGRRLVSAGVDGTVRVIELGDPRRTEVHKGHSHGIVSLAFAGDGETVVSGDLHGEVRLWSTPPVVLVKRSDESPERSLIHIPRFWPGGRSGDSPVVPLLALDRDRILYGRNSTLRLIDATTGKRLDPIPDESSAPLLSAVVIGRSQGLAVCRFGEGAIHFIDLVKKRERERRSFADYTVTCLAYDEKADVLLAGTREGVGLLIKPPAGLPAKP